jgi:hypothetical protein
VPECPLSPSLHIQIRIFGEKRKWPHSFLNVAIINAGNDLLSHTLSRAVQSALRGLTSVFGMGTGGTPAVRSPTSVAAVSYLALGY